MEPGQQTFDTFGRWLLTRLRADLAPGQKTPASPLYAFFTGLYEDMLANPGEYFIPEEPFVTFFARVTLTPEETAQHEALKATRMRVRKAVFAYLEFLYKLGKTGSVIDAPDGGKLLVSRAELEKLAAEGVKKAKSRHFLAALERTGLSFSPGDPVAVTNRLYPGMPAALVTFSQACAPVKDFDFYLFRRCDLSVVDGKRAPDFADALRFVPQPFQSQVAETDERLQQMKFKREIFMDEGDANYRVRYNKKGDLVVYWCRIQETFQPDLHHYLRWKLDSDLTPRLFTRLDETAPGLADLVFTGVKQCAHCYAGNCMDRTHIERGGVVKEVCKGSGWNRIGYSHTDYERLWTVLAALNELVAKS
jgi:hypothetical protein